MQCLTVVVSGCGSVLVEMVLHVIPWWGQINKGVSSLISLRNEHMTVLYQKEEILVDTWLH